MNTESIDIWYDKCIWTCMCLYVSYKIEEKKKGFPIFDYSVGGGTGADGASSTLAGLAGRKNQYEVTHC